MIPTTALVIFAFALESVGYGFLYFGWWKMLIVRHEVMFKSIGYSHLGYIAYAFITAALQAIIADPFSYIADDLVFGGILGPFAFGAISIVLFVAVSIWPSLELYRVANLFGCLGDVGFSLAVVYFNQFAIIVAIVRQAMWTVATLRMRNILQQYIEFERKPKMVDEEKQALTV